jgi:hypothetical protein
VKKEMTETSKELSEILEVFEDGDIGYLDLGQWLACNGWQLVQENSI